jgi:AraC family ethanolamine operon transcriptional activator
MTEPFLLHLNFTDFDDYCANVRNWNLDYRQIESGQFFSELLMAGNATMMLTRAQIRRKMIQKGAPPPGMITFGLLVDPAINIHWRNIDISGDMLIVFPENGELDSITYDDFDVFVLSLTEEKLNRTCQALQLPDIRTLINHDEAFRCDSQQLAELRNWLSSITQQLTLNSKRGPNMAHLLHIEQELTHKLISILAGRFHSVSKQTFRKRDLALLIVKDYIADSDSGIPTIPELCQVAAVSERTLEYAFRERYGLTPKTYLLYHRLNAFRKQLRVTDSETGRVTEIARQHGFWHMGALGADYKKLFAELPSETLKRQY